MWQVIGRGVLVASAAAVLAVAIALGDSSQRIDAGSSAAWCYDGDSWLGYSEGVPGSVTERRFTDCLRGAAGRGEVLAFPGKMLDRGALIEAGDGAIYWEFEVSRETILRITAYDDRVVFGDTCETRIEVQSGVLATTAPGYPCSGRQRIEQRDARVVNPDFTIYVIGKQFVADGEDGWHHFGIDRTWWRDRVAQWNQIELTNRWPGVWISTEHELHNPAGGQIFTLRQPLAGNYQFLEYYRFSDWEYRVYASLIPTSFSRSGYAFLPNRNAYWLLIKEAAEAIIDDLYRGRDDRPVLELNAFSWGLTHADDGSYFLIRANAAELLQEIARLIAGPNAGYGAAFTGTLLMLWDRYVPGFDQNVALQLAERYDVAVGDHPPVNPVSGLTARVNEILTRPPDALPSDHEPIAPEELHLSVTLELGKTYDHWSDVLIVTSELVPSCVVEESYSDGTTYRLRHGPQGKFTVNPGGTWNGINLLGFSGGPGVSGMYVRGTPTLVGRVRVEITTKCPGGYAQEPRFAGYSEIIVVDPGAEEE